MSKKIFLTLLLISLLMLTTCYSYAATGVGNTIKEAGNTAGNALAGATGTVVDGARGLANGASNMMKDMINANGDMENDATNTLATTDEMFDNNDGDYTATRTATGSNNMLGMSDTTWTWLILGAVGLAIVGLVWYYGAQYEHRNYNND